MVVRVLWILIVDNPYIKNMSWILMVDKNKYTATVGVVSKYCTMIGWGNSVNDADWLMGNIVLEKQVAMRKL